MKSIVFIFLLCSFAYCGNEYGKAWEYHFQGSKSYAVVFTTQIRAYLEIRSYDDNSVYESVCLYSPYAEPTFEVKDVVSDDGLEFLLRTSNGGTGIGQTHLNIYSIFNGHIREIGHFILEEKAESYPEATWSHSIHGTVEYPKKNVVVYRATEVITENANTKTNTIVETYVFDTSTFKFKKQE